MTKWELETSGEHSQKHNATQVLFDFMVPFHISHIRLEFFMSLCHLESAWIRICHLDPLQHMLKKRADFPVNTATRDETNELWNVKKISVKIVYSPDINKYH